MLDPLIVTAVLPWSVCVMCLSEKLVSPAKTTEPIKLRFVLWTQVGPSNHVLSGRVGFLLAKTCFYGLNQFKQVKTNISVWHFFLIHEISFVSHNKNTVTHVCIQSHISCCLKYASMKNPVH